MFRSLNVLKYYLTISCIFDMCMYVSMVHFSMNLLTMSMTNGRVAH